MWASSGMFDGNAVGAGMRVPVNNHPGPNNAALKDHRIDASPLERAAIAAGGCLVCDIELPPSVFLRFMIVEIFHKLDVEIPRVLVVDFTRRSLGQGGIDVPQQFRGSMKSPFKDQSQPSHPRRTPA